MKKVLIIDGHGLAFRAFYAVPPLNAPDGTPTNAILGFINMLMKVEEEIVPECCSIVFDAPGPTFRHEAYPEYKMGRKPTPEEFKQQLPLLQTLLSALGYPVISKIGVEADDVIATMAKMASEKGIEAVVVSSDKDLLQILGDNIRMLRPIKGISTLKTFDSKAFKDEYAFPPSSVPDYLALLGDTADNVPGVPGVGEKTALLLIGEFHTLEQLYSSLESQKPALVRKLEAGKENAFKSRDLIRLKYDVDIEEPCLASATPDFEKALTLCKSLGLNKLMEKINRLLVQEPMSEANSEVFAAAQEVKQVAFEELLDADELAVSFLHGGKYPPIPEGVELQFADVEGRYTVLQGHEITGSVWGRLSGKRLFLEDYKALLACWGTEVLKNNAVWDLKTAHYLLHPDRASHTLFDLYPALNKTDNLPVFALLRAAHELKLELRRYSKLSDLMESIDLPLIPVLVEMEQRGIRIEGEVFRSLQKELEQRIADIEAEIADKGGEEINLNSPKQVAWLLFERLQLPSGAKTKGKTAYSTSASVLEGLAALNLPHSDVPRLLLEHRELTKMLSGFVLPLQKSANLHEGSIHTTFEAAFTGTGRLSSRDPNLQNLPAFGHWSKRLKEGLVPRGTRNVFVAADYSQIELRILAHLANEERLLEAFKAQRDIHRETASWVFSVPPEEVSPELRRVAKMINFGLLYGMSSFGLAERLGLERPEASRIISRYFSALPGVKKYLDASAEEAEKRGYTQTLFGRIRPIAEAAEGVRDKNGLKRVAINTPIQGTAADIARKAMIHFSQRFSEDKDVALILQIHDSLICECPEDRATEIGNALSDIMRSAAVLAVPLEVDLKIGRSLAEV